MGRKKNFPQSFPEILKNFEPKLFSSYLEDYSLLRILAHQTRFSVIKLISNITFKFTVSKKKSEKKVSQKVTFLRKFYKILPRNRRENDLF